MEKCYCGNEKLTNYSAGYYMCPRCKSLVSKHDFSSDVYNVTEEDQDLYGKNYWESIMVKEAGVKDIDELIDMYIPERAAYWLKYVLQYVKLGGKVADVGCGLGQFSYLMKEAGFEQTAYELSPQICECIKEKLNLEVVCGELNSRTEKYDSILALDVFEHLLEPEQFLEDCKNRLTDNGILIMQTPCYDPQYNYEEMRQYKPKFEHLLVEEQHIYLFSRDSITNILKQHGFYYVQFEPAFFGDDYDMFLFASREPIQKNSEDEIEQYLNTVQNGRLIKALIALYDQNVRKDLERKAMEAQREEILRDEETLTALVHEYQQAAQERLELIEKLSEEMRKLQDEIERRRSIFEKMYKKLQQKKGE